MALLLVVKADHLRLLFLVAIILLFVFTVACLVAASAVSPKIRPRILRRFAGVSWPICII
jgi:hypothetical protein